MKGVIFNILEELVIEEAGMPTWNAILASLQLKGIYTAGHSYPDEELMALVQEISIRLALPTPKVIGHFGEYLFRQLNQRYPEFTAQQPDLKRFLLSVHDVIHVEVNKLYENPNLPTFSYHQPADNILVMQYQSPRKLCILAEGLVRGAAQYYDTEIHMTHPVCMHQQADHCDLVIEFLSSKVTL
ncbi:heme NO-binding domain-containing protein [Amphritea sp. 2_MG-2023]|uniref:heme NO-binding domain-containing protein n=1 Tax=Amphritea TaxID=515417 RepID=UPI001C0788C4|nr:MULTISPECIES: heme NO-binding domain-containing protein [Amphritea]MBU2964275.1 heme NO-binding domain-containing protein [Amphritea atlantica]MDO6419467.1 heme NO-binding domain-containing protein [Amphritea sp. 2_MG-2023]